MFQINEDTDYMYFWNFKYSIKMNIATGARLLTWANYNPSMDK